jgi:hypothetical protein
MLDIELNIAKVNNNKAPDDEVIADMTKAGGPTGVKWI